MCLCLCRGTCSTLTLNETYDFPVDIPAICVYVTARMLSDSMILWTEISSLYYNRCNESVSTSYHWCCRVQTSAFLSFSLLCLISKLQLEWLRCSASIVQLSQYQHATGIPTACTDTNRERQHTNSTRKPSCLFLFQSSFRVWVWRLCVSFDIHFRTSNYDFFIQFIPYLPLGTTSSSISFFYVTYFGILFRFLRKLHFLRYFER